ncbi:uncharacterized protein A4U43_C03F2600 [Asparagus officinalis]|uniref:Uncharacterized protein n=1 Tax=Asparagus officinalis TaxID=4686 RepID=A0A5P1F8L0_ASPOF|nr:uncharacterized protein A4U43_C03F2600 [Asparagus officinalis]
MEDADTVIYDFESSNFTSVIFWLSEVNIPSGFSSGNFHRLNYLSSASVTPDEMVNKDADQARGFGVGDGQLVEGASASVSSSRVFGGRGASATASRGFGDDVEGLRPARSWSRTTSRGFGVGVGSSMVFDGELVEGRRGVGVSWSVEVSWNAGEEREMGK